MENPDNHQDWTPIIIRKKKLKPTSYISTSSGYASSVSSTINPLDDDPTLFRLTHEQTQELILLRTGKGLTRKELATNLNVSENEISKLENNKSNNKVLYHKLKNYLKR